MIKIKSIRFFNHEIFGDKEFDFSVGNKIPDVIVFAGENGSGKTRLLEEISNACNYTYYVSESQINKDNLVYEVKLDLNSENYVNMYSPEEKINMATLYYISRWYL